MDSTPLPESLLESRVMKNWADSLKTRIDNVNALAIVATFLAAVQAQLISFTWENNNTGLQEFVNAVSFIGLAFDVVGTATGLISALTLQPSNARIHEAVFHAEASLATWKEITDELTTISLEERTFSGRSIPKEFFQEHMQKQRERIQRRSVLEARKKTWEAEEEVRVKQLDDLRSKISAGKVKGYAPLLMMAIGILSFFVGLLGFVVDTQPRAVWIPTLSVVLVSALALPFDAMDLKFENWNPRRLFGEWVVGMARKRAQRHSKAFDNERDDTQGGGSTTVASAPAAPGSEKSV